MAHFDIMVSPKSYCKGIVEAETRFQLQCYVDGSPLVLVAVRQLATVYGQCLGQAEENGTLVKGHRCSRQQCTMVKFCRAIHANWKL